MRKFLNMLHLSNNSNAPPTEGDDVAAEADEPPEDRKNRNKQKNNPYTKSKLPDAKKESLLTRALRSSPESSPCERSNPLDALMSNGVVPILSPSTSSSGDETISKRSKPQSIAWAVQQPRPSPVNVDEKLHPKPATDPHESEVEANLGRKRCITFACARKLSIDDTKALSDTVKDVKEPTATKRKSALTFICPAPNRTPLSHDHKTAPQYTDRRPSLPPHGRRSPAPHIRKHNSEPVPTVQTISPTQQQKEKLPTKIAVTGLGEFKLSDVTRFHEFGSSGDEDDDWVKENTDDKPKITMSDCMRKENAIRKLGEEVEEEVRQAEENGEYDDDDDGDDDGDGDGDDNDDDEDEDDDGDEDDNDDGDSTVHDGLSDAGNESDNEAGFASGDDTSDTSEFSFWTPGMATAATSFDHAGSVQFSERKVSNSSFESLVANNDKDVTPIATRKRSIGRPVKTQKRRPTTPDLPDSTDFVCGTLDEDRPLEAAYKSCMEERRLSKRVPIPQDIDPSFPTSDPEDDDNEDDDDDNNDVEVESASTARRSRFKQNFEMFELRGRKKGDSSPSNSPKNRPSPQPSHRQFGRSPRRLRSPPPLVRRKSPAPPSRRPAVAIVHNARPAGINITGLAQRGPRVRTKSVPRTPNPFFARLDQLRRSSKTVAMKSPSDRPFDRSHTRGAVDIVAGLEKKRQKRKEKFWRQHCRKAAKEQQERRPLPGKGAERMKELGLEVAERFRAYGFGQDTQLVLSI